MPCALKDEDPISGVNNEGSTRSGLSGAGDNTDQQEYKENYPFFVFCCCPDPLVTHQSSWMGLVGFSCIVWNQQQYIRRGRIKCCGSVEIPIC